MVKRNRLWLVENQTFNVSRDAGIIRGIYFEDKSRSIILDLPPTIEIPFVRLLNGEKWKNGKKNHLIGETRNGYNIYSGCFIMVHHMNKVYIYIYVPPHMYMYICVCELLVRGASE